MADRFFPNEMPDFIPETAATAGIPAVAAGDSLTRLLYLPYKSVCDTLKNSVVDIKDKVTSFYFLYLLVHFVEWFVWHLGFTWSVQIRGAHQVFEVFPELGFVLEFGGDSHSP